jgi:PTS system nitrogen regulatory IIA component
MRLIDILSADLVLPDVAATDRDALISEVASAMHAARPDIDASSAARVLLDRERLGSTGVGNGFAIPHGKLPLLRGMVACFARSTSGVAFGSLDQKPAHLFLFLLAPEGASSQHLKALALASRVFRDGELRARLLAETDRRALWSLLCAEDSGAHRVDN